LSGRDGGGEHGIGTFRYTAVKSRIAALTLVGAIA